MAPSDCAIRQVICVDGTWFTADGSHGKGYGNITNVYRIYASIQSGIVKDPSGLFYEQRKHYEPGVGAAEQGSLVARTMSGALGKGFDDIIREMYQRCCLLGERDEVWLYGFSRGAYIVRAVAGILHHIGALKSAHDDSKFKKEYGRALEILGSKFKHSTVGDGQVHNFLHQSTRTGPAIKFVGLFDTVKFVDDKNLHDISFNKGIWHMRHALALNEKRLEMQPEYVFPDAGHIDGDRSLLQAWFIGAHSDMGGSEKKDGLSLYPLQWMLLESQSKGLCMSFSDAFQNKLRVQMDNPLTVVFPETERDGKGSGPWSCMTENQIRVEMHDIRKVHEPERYQGKYGAKINHRGHRMLLKMDREVFDDAKDLRGYRPSEPQGTIIHPSVYQILDEDQLVKFNKQSWKYLDQLEAFRETFLGRDQSGFLNRGFWSERESPVVEDVPSLRILVCGNAGIGKSTLINCVFGAEVTQSSTWDSGIHHVDREITHPNRPNLIVHDSGGFEAGGSQEIELLEDFVKRKAAQIEMQDRLHVIWFCVEMNNDRVKQHATRLMFAAISKYATDIPIIIVATKSDHFLSVQHTVGRRHCEGLGIPAEQILQFADSYAEDQIPDRLDEIQSELAKVPGGRFDGCVAVSKDIESSIQQLNEITIESFNHEQVRLVYVAAQTASVDKKIALATSEVMKSYRHVLGTAISMRPLPRVSMSKQPAAALSICSTILKCFGLSNLEAQAVLKTVQTELWDDLGRGESVTLAQSITAMGLGVALLSTGLPLFGTVVNVPTVVPATVRLMLMVAGDLILLLTRAFKQAIFTRVGVPELSDIARAARYYSSVSSEVHKQILDLVPRGEMVPTYRYNTVERGFEAVIAVNKSLVTEDIKSTPHMIKIRPNPRRQQVLNEVNQKSEQDLMLSLPEYSEVVSAAERAKIDLSLGKVKLERP